MRKKIILQEIQIESEKGIDRRNVSLEKPTRSHEDWG